MKKMSADSFSAARTYIMSHGRPLDQARFNFHFAGGDLSALVEALAAFQNEDGGFGHGLEPDLRTPASSAIATSLGMSILREVDAAPELPLVNAAVRYHTVRLVVEGVELDWQTNWLDVGLSVSVPLGG